MPEILAEVNGKEKNLFVKKDLHSGGVFYIVLTMKTNKTPEEMRDIVEALRIRLVSAHSACQVYGNACSDKTVQRLLLMEADEIDKALAKPEIYWWNW